MNNWRLSPSVFLVSVVLSCLIFVGSTTSDAAGQTIPSTIIYVKMGGTGTCNSWADACELQTALTAISTRTLPGEIWVAAGIYYPTNGTERAATFALKNNVAVYGGFSGNETDLEQRNWVDNVTILSGNIKDVALKTDNSFQVVTANDIDATAKLDGFTITEGYGIIGAGIYFDHPSSIVDLSCPSLTNLIITKNHVSAFGGGLYARDCNPILTNVRFSDNESRDGGGVYIGQSNLQLTDVTFTNNTASSEGGGFYLSDSIATLLNVTFTENNAGSGGGMYSDSLSFPTLTDVTFTNNEAAGPIAPNNGGGFYGTANIISASFTGNTASGDGGGLYFTKSGTVEGLTLENVDFRDNKAGGNGAGLYTNLLTTITLSDLEFAGNQAAGSGGGLYQNGGVSTLSNIVVSNNTAVGNGGGMYGNGNLTNVSFTNNMAVGSGGGKSGNGNLTNVTFTANTAGGIGGGNSGNGNLSSVSFTNNTADGVGGGMSGSGKLSDVVFVSNSSLNNSGGGLYSFGLFGLENVTFEQNTAKFDGGGFYATAENNYTTSTLSGVTFSNNTTTTGNGGGMWMGLSGLGVDLSITNVTFSSNSAGQNGGGLYVYDMAQTYSEYTNQNVTFSGNNAVSGGAIYLGLSSKGALSNSIMWGNTPGQIAYDTSKSHVLNITNSIIQGGWVEGTNILDLDPKLAALADNGGLTRTHALMHGSAAIDALEPALCPLFDQRGVARPIDGNADGIAKCDLGAYEAEAIKFIYLPLISR